MTTPRKSTDLGSLNRIKRQKAVTPTFKEDVAWHIKFNMDATPRSWRDRRAELASRHKTDQRCLKHLEPLST